MSNPLQQWIKIDSITSRKQIMFLPDIISKATAVFEVTTTLLCFLYAHSKMADTYRDKLVTKTPTNPQSRGGGVGVGGCGAGIIFGKIFFRQLVLDIPHLRKRKRKSLCFVTRNSRLNWNLEMLVSEDQGKTGENPLGARTRTNNKLNPHMTPSPGIEPGPHWWEACVGSLTSHRVIKGHNCDDHSLIHSFFRNSIYSLLINEFTQ